MELANLGMSYVALCQGFEIKICIGQSAPLSLPIYTKFAIVEQQNSDFLK
jgi:hypothetical protein